MTTNAPHEVNKESCKELPAITPSPAPPPFKNSSLLPPIPSPREEELLRELEIARRQTIDLKAELFSSKEYIKQLQSDEETIKDILSLEREKVNKYIALTASLIHSMKPDIKFGDVQKLAEEYEKLNNKFIRLVIAERKRQDEKWGQQDHAPSMWISILGEEFGEVCKAVCEATFSGYASTGNWDGYKEELVQVAAVAIAALESIERQGV